MPKYSEQDLKYAAEFREEIHREALAIVRETRPYAMQVMDRHPVEDYFQENWEYPGRLYTIVAIPYGYKSRKALVDTIVRDTLSETPETESSYTRELRNTTESETGRQKCADSLDMTPQDDPFDRLITDYPDLAVDYCIVGDERYCGYASHRRALKTAFGRCCADWDGDPDKAVGSRIPPEELFSSAYPPEKLNYRKAFLYPPHENSYTGKDFVRVNAALFPNGTDALEVYTWDTDWSDYFDEGHEWWGALCLTVYDKTLDRFVVIMASATD